MIGMVPINSTRITLDKSFNRSITPETYYTLNGNNSNILNAQRHVINTKFSHKIDSTHEFKFRAKVKLTISEDEKENIQETYGSNDSLENKLTQIALVKRTLIKNIQTELKRLRFSQLQVNGEMNANTKNAIKAYKKQKKLIRMVYPLKPYYFN